MPTKKTKKTKKNTKSVAKKTPAKKLTKKAKPPVVVTPPVVPVASPVVPVKTQAELMWEEIKNLPIQMFGLPDQTVAMHVNFIPVEPSKLYLTIRSTAALPSLEAAIAPKFAVELADKFVIVTRVPQALVLSKKK